MLMHNPPHPDEVLRDLCLEPLGFTVTWQQRLSALAEKSECRVEWQAGISPDVAIRLSIVFVT